MDGRSLKSPETACKMATSVFYLHTSRRLDSGTVFYKIAGEARARVVLQLFRKEYVLPSGESFSMTPEDEVSQEDRILFDEALDWLGVYDDPDPGIYDPPPTQDIMDRAQYARRADSWDSYVAAEDAAAVNSHDSKPATDTRSPLPSDKNAGASKVFISYSHDSEEHLNRVLALSDRLRGDGIDCHIDRYEDSPPQGWPRWCEKQVRDADFVLVACTEIYLRRFRGEEEHGRGQGGTWEGHIITQELYNAQSSNSKFLPILFDGQDEEFIPTPLQSATHYKLPERYEDLYRRLTNQPLIVRPALGSLKAMPRRQMPALPVLKPRKSFLLPETESFSHEETIRSGGGHLYDDLIAENFISHSVGAPYTVRELIEEIAQHSNKPIPIESMNATFGEEIAPRGRTFFGNPGDFLEQILSAQPGVHWWISNKGLNIRDERFDDTIAKQEPKSREYETQQVGNDKSAAISHLYSRIEKVAIAMGGTTHRTTASRSLPGAMVAVPRSEDVPALLVEMPNSFHVDFAPLYPLNIGNALFVQAKRIHRGSSKTDWQFTFGPEGWRRTQAPLSDDEIRTCLTPEGPPPAF